MTAIARFSSPSWGGVKGKRASGPATSRRSTSRSMRAIARNLAIMAAAAAALSLADTHADVVDVFAAMTSALSDDNTAGFMAGFDKNMPDYDKLRGYVAALI